MTSIEEIIAKTEADLKEVLDQITTTEYRLKALNREATIHRRVLDALKTALEATAGSAAAQAFDEVPAPAPEPAKEVAAPTPLPQAVAANGFDRAAIKRQLREWHIRYPVARSYRIPSQMMRQAQRAVILDHPGYRGDWIANGGVDLGSSNVVHTIQDLYDAGAMLGIDIEAIGNAAHKVQRLLAIYGTPGVDHHNWEERP